MALRGVPPHGAADPGIISFVRPAERIFLCQTSNSRRGMVRFVPVSLAKRPARCGSVWQDTSSFKSFSFQGGVRFGNLCFGSARHPEEPSRRSLSFVGWAPDFSADRRRKIDSVFLLRSLCERCTLRVLGWVRSVGVTSGTVGSGDPSSPAALSAAGRRFFLDGRRRKMDSVFLSRSFVGDGTLNSRFGMPRPSFVWWGRPSRSPGLVRISAPSRGKFSDDRRRKTKFVFLLRSFA